MEPTAVFVAGRNHLDDISSVMDKGFAKDPTVLWYSEDPKIFDATHHRYVEMCAEPAFDHGGVHASAGFDGAAIWYPPDVRVADADYEEFITTLPFPQRFGGLTEIAEASDAHRPSGPHWTLELIAVDPAAQNKGVGGKLLAFGLAKCDRANLPVYLASSNVANLPFYVRHGFVQMAEVNISGLPTMFPMIRQPCPDGPVGD